jgi:hypothetical protein
VNDILKEEHLPMHYTVDRLNGTDRFIINMYFPDNPEELIVISANIEGVGLTLRGFESLGYIADRIAF